MPRKQKKYHFIYKTTCLITNKYYIGMHSTDNLEDGYLGSGKKLWYSLNKYGKEKHKIEKLEFFKNRKKLKEREKQMVNEELLHDPLCMNLKEGGNGGGGFWNKAHQLKCSIAGGKATIKKLQEKHFYKLQNDLEYRNKYCQKIKDTHKGFKGKFHSEETKNKMSISHKKIKMVY